MEGFTYVDIFSTKGIEYIIVIVFLILIVCFWNYIKTDS
jgi:glycine cleavage system H protein